MNTPAIATPDLPPAQDAKRCTKCGEEKHLSEFGIDNKRQDKLNYNCKPCCRKAAEAYRSKYGISVNQRVSLWKKSHPTEIKKSSDKYYARNKQKIKAYSASKYLENPDIFKQRVFAYRQANPEKSKEFCRAWSRANPEKNAARHSKRRAQKLASVGQHTAADIKKLIVLQKNKCAVCCISIKDGYHVDHVIPLIAGGGNGKDNIQLLCPPCNRKKGSKHPVDFMQSQGKLL